MSAYQAPVSDMRFVLEELAGFARLEAEAGFVDADPEMVAPILEEANKLASQVLAPLNHSGDTQGVHLDENGKVVVADGFAEAYRQYVEGGWAGLQFAARWGGQGLPFSLAIPVQEMWHSANLSWGLCPLLSQGAAEAVSVNASDALRERYLPKLVSGEWTGTMNLTEPQAGSDLSDIKTRALPEGDHYRITGQKIFITWGDHEMAENVVHLVLARLPDAPAGVRGISLFLVPKYLLNEDGSIGERNDCRAFSLEKKLGIHACPTCVMSFGDNEGAVGYLVGEENKGLACMFTMMNNARLTVGLQGVAVAERACQQALAYAQERVQGIAPGYTERGPISRHPDVQRMLMTMQALTEAARSLAYVGCHSVDWAHSGHPSADYHQRRVGLLTPIIKGWATEIAQEVTSLNIQCHGGMGFIEETGAAQLARDARILPIYEGTNGIQAIDLAGRKTVYDDGHAMNELLTEMQDGLAQVVAAGRLDERHTRQIAEALAALKQGNDDLVALKDDPAAVQGRAFPYLMLAGVVIGGYYSLLAADRSSAAQGELDAGFYQQKKRTALFYLDQILPRYLSYAAMLAAPAATAV